MSLPIVLGSSSKWRRVELAKMLGLSSADAVEWIAPDIDEKAIRDTDPSKMTLMIARAKAEALGPRITKPCILICSDQVIQCNGEIREKPSNEEEARKFLKSYSDGAPAEAIVAVVVINTQTGAKFEGVAYAKQFFKPLPESLIDFLIKDGDIFTCAGGFVVEKMTECWDKLEGEIETITGMPKTLTMHLIKNASA